MSRFKDIDILLNGLMPYEPTLKELIEQRMKELDILPTNLLPILGTNSRTLKGIMEGTQKNIDYSNLIKIASFLQLPIEKVIKLFVEAIEKNFPIISYDTNKIQFIKENFDLIVLKKAGFINSLTDFEQIEKNINSRLGLKSIFEYKKPVIDVAFSEGYYKPKNDLTRSFWLKSALACFEELDNPNEYRREELVKFFPKIRWHSMNEEFGLIEVIKCLFNIGITVIYQPPLLTLQLRGATLAYNDKPCIVLTNYMGYYPTLWFALIHELYHVLFDFDEIQNNTYHFTGDKNEQLSVMVREKEADEFSREYLFSNEKMNSIKTYLHDYKFVETFARNNHIHPSIIYAFNAYDNSKINSKLWYRVKKYSPDINICLKHIDYKWKENLPIEEVFNIKRKLEIYN